MFGRNARARRCMKTSRSLQALCIVQSGLDAAQDAWAENVKHASKSLKKVRKKIKPVVATMQDSMQAGLEQTQDALQSRLDVAQDAWAKNVKQAGKSLKKAQKKMKPALESVQDSIQSGLEQTQDVLQGGLGAAQVALGKNVKRARKGIKKAKESLQAVQDSVQHELGTYARKRRVAKTLFRFGLLAGVVVALLYTPWPGSEIRHRLVVWWQRLFPQQG